MHPFHPLRDLTFLFYTFSVCFFLCLTNLTFYLSLFNFFHFAFCILPFKLFILFPFSVFLEPLSLVLSVTSSFRYITFSSFIHRSFLSFSLFQIFYSFSRFTSFSFSLFPHTFLRLYFPPTSFFHYASFFLPWSPSFSLGLHFFRSFIFSSFFLSLAYLIFSSSIQIA